MGKAVEVYDTTLRDGSQGEGVNFSLADKLNLTREIDSIGVHYIEGGWPGSNPKDMDYFRAVRQFKMKNARIVAFGSTHYHKNTPSDDPNLRRLVEAKTPVVTIVGKAWDLNVQSAMRVSPDRNLQMISASVKYLKDFTDQVFLDAEHFFDGYVSNPEYALKALEAAAEAGAQALILCDTNGGSVTSRIGEITALVVKMFSGVSIGIHVHNDGGMAVANSVEAVRVGATQVQGTMNGFGERTGNADLIQVIPNLELKLGRHCIGKKNLQRLTQFSRYVYETANFLPRDDQPFVGRSAFAHKAGLHVSAVTRNSTTYEHVCPESVGNERRILMSELSGRSNVLACSEVDSAKDPEKAREILDRVMELESQGYSFDNAEASFHLLVHKILGSYQPSFQLKNVRVVSEFDANDGRRSEARVELAVDGVESHKVSQSSQGPVNALNDALHKALLSVYPTLKDLRLLDYKVHIVNAPAGAAAKVRVIIKSTDGKKIWGTVGVSENIIEASCLALMDSIEYMLNKNGG